MKKTPTPKQIRGARNIAEAVITGNGKTKGQCLREAGYSEEVAKTPSKALEKAGFKQALAEFLPINETIQVHRDLLLNGEDKIRMEAVKESYKVHGVNTEKGGQSFGGLLQQINIISGGQIKGGEEDDPIDI